MPNIYTKCATNITDIDIHLKYFYLCFLIYASCFLNACVYCPYMVVSIFIHGRSTLYIKLYSIQTSFMAF